MKQKFILIVLMSVIICHAAVQSNAQDSTAKIIWVKMTARLMDQSKVNGYLYTMNTDSLIFLKNKLQGVNTVSLLQQSGLKTTTINAEQVKKISFQKMKNAPWIGGLIGLGVGVITGFALGNDPPGWFSYTAGQKAFLLGSTGAVIGLIVGGVVREMATLRFVIKGNKTKYREFQKEMKLYSLLK